MTPEEITEMREIVDAATQDDSHWEADALPNPSGGKLLSYNPDTGTLGVVPIVPADGEYAVLEGANAQYISTFKPSKVREILNLLETYQQQLQEVGSSFVELQSVLSSEGIDPFDLS